MSAARFIVTGGVQGVFFRASTREQAQRLGVRGHAINLPDGSVEVIAAGHDDAIGTLERWLHQGPPMAQVERVERLQAEDASAGEGFTTC